MYFEGTFPNSKRLVVKGIYTMSGKYESRDSRGDRVFDDYASQASAAFICEFIATTCD